MWGNAEMGLRKEICKIDSFGTLRSIDNKPLGKITGLMPRPLVRHEPPLFFREERRFELPQIKETWNQNPLVFKEPKYELKDLIKSNYPPLISSFDFSNTNGIFNRGNGLNTLSGYSDSNNLIDLFDSSSRLEFKKGRKVNLLQPDLDDYSNCMHGLLRACCSVCKNNW